MLWLGCGHVQLDPLTCVRMHALTRIRLKAVRVSVPTLCACVDICTVPVRGTRYGTGTYALYGGARRGVRACMRRVLRARRAYTHHVRIRACAFCASSIGLCLLSSFELKKFSRRLLPTFCVPLFSACTMYVTTTRSASLPSRASC